MSNTSLAIGFTRDPLMVIVAAALMIGLAAIAVWRAAIRVTLYIGDRRAAMPLLEPTFEYLIRRPVAIGPDLDIGDDLFTGGSARLDRR